MNHGKFVWYDLMTTDVKGAEAFYRSVVGWEIRDSGMTDRQYSILSIGDEMVGGMMPIPANAGGARPGWNGYIGVDNVDDYTRRVESAGGKIHHAPQDIPGIGRFSVVADPHGAAFILFQGMGQQPEKQDNMTPGHIAWHELHAGDRDADFAFYSTLFGWTKDTAMDMGPMGIYQMFRTNGTHAVGGVMTRTPETPHPFWLYYFAVKGIDAAIERVKAAGGKIINGPQEVPGGAWIVQGIDPQGAMFALVGSK